MIIRPGKYGDIIKVSRLWLDMVRELAPEYTPNVEWWRKHTRAAIRNSNYAMFVAEEGGKIVGFIDCFLIEEPLTGKIHVVGRHMYVLPSYRKCCIASKLYRKCISAAKDQGAQVIDIFCENVGQDRWLTKGYSVASMVMRKKVRTTEV